MKMNILSFDIHTAVFQGKFSIEKARKYLCPIKTGQFKRSGKPPKTRHYERAILGTSFIAIVEQQMQCHLCNIKN